MRRSRLTGLRLSVVACGEDLHWACSLFADGEALGTRSFQEIRIRKRPHEGHRCGEHSGVTVDWSWSRRSAWSQGEIVRKQEEGWLSERCEHLPHRSRRPWLSWLTSSPVLSISSRVVKPCRRRRLGGLCAPGEAVGGQQASQIAEGSRRNENVYSPIASDGGTKEREDGCSVTMMMPKRRNESTLKMLRRVLVLPSTI